MGKGNTTAFQVHVLASGSKGNATVVAYKNTSILIDAGISARRITQGMKALGLDAAKLAGIFITHEHSDHIAGLLQMVKQYDVPVLTREGTMKALIGKRVAGYQSFTVLTKANITVGDISVETFKTKHDAVDSMGISCYGGSHKMTLMTDTGTIDDRMLRAMDESDMLVLEANYDPQMLRYGPYPPDLKRRVAGEYGHLSNESAAQALLMMKRPDNLQVILAHRSEKNNAVPVVNDTVHRLTGEVGLIEGKDFRLQHGQPKECVSMVGQEA
ncbi:MBL fold metallo-hydrolase [Veillonella magna]|uniref:MBL fold metallo-hydrolase n=1 Tax=Veillonella magna TaxID=464322 RepID=UPI00040BC95D|nr:MBL fold metallo-hydrolase [Veillonella magna]